MPIDVHAHHIPTSWLEAIATNPAAYGCDAGQEGGRAWFKMGSEERSYPLAALLDLEDRLRFMDKAGIDRQVLSPPMSITGYELDDVRGQALARLFNESVVESAKTHPDRLIPVATLPLQSPAAAVRELDHAVQELGVRMVEIGTNVNGANLDEPRFEPVFARAADLEVLVQLHPHNVAATDRLRHSYLDNLVGNPLDSTIAAAALIFGGVLERHPTLRVCLVHGGGCLASLIGRWTHGYHATRRAHSTPQPPEEYARRLYVDTLVHDAGALARLASLLGTDHLLLGTDYPYDMGERDPLGELARAGLENDPAIVGATAARLLRLA